MTNSTESELVSKISGWLNQSPEEQACYTPPGPLLTGIAERRNSIMANTGGFIVLEENPKARAIPKPWYEIDSYEEVTANKKTIERLAAQYKIDPDFVKAIVWMESTHGWYDRIDPHNKTIRPMNVHDTLWSQLGVNRRDLQNPTLNVAAGVHILAAIRDRTAEPTNEKIATLYNQLSAHKVNNYGKTVAFYTIHRPWDHRRNSSRATPTSCPTNCHY